MIKACIFDLDGTLLDTSYALQKCMNESLKILCERKKELRDKELSINLDLTKLFVGDGLKIYVDRVLNRFELYSDELSNELFNIYQVVAKEHNLFGVKPYENILGSLKRLKEKNIKLAILSNKMQEVVEANCAKFFEKDLFDIIYGERKGINIKPDPRSLNMLIEELELKKDEILYFGDTNVDMQTAKNAKVVGVGVLWGFRDKAELVNNGASYLISDPLEILDLIVDKSL